MHPLYCVSTVFITAQLLPENVVMRTKQLLLKFDLIKCGMSTAATKGTVSDINGHSGDNRHSGDNGDNWHSGINGHSGDN